MPWFLVWGTKAYSNCLSPYGRSKFQSECPVVPSDATSTSTTHETPTPLFAIDGMTNANFYSMVEIVFMFDNYYTLSGKSGATVQRDDHPLQAGKYFINTAGSLTVKR